jgi:hypothetical protein
MVKLDQPVLLGDVDIEEAWQLYERRFAPLRAAALQRHLMYREEFHYLCRDPNVEKWRAFDDHGRLVGLATYTNVLTAMPLISPEYFAARWPQQYAAGRIWYCGFVAVADDAPRATFLKLIERMFQQGLGDDGRGVISLDYCTANDTLAEAVAKTLTKFAERAGFTSFEARLRDRQGYWTYGPAPLEVATR